MPLLRDLGVNLHSRRGTDAAVAPLQLDGNDALSGYMDFPAQRLSTPNNFESLVVRVVET